MRVNATLDERRFWIRYADVGGRAWWWGSCWAGLGLGSIEGQCLYHVARGGARHEVDTVSEGRGAGLVTEWQ